MESKRKIGLSVLFALGFFAYCIIISEMEDTYDPYEYSPTLPYHNSYEGKDEINYYSSYPRETIVSDKQKDKIFKTTIKGYRESTYWGNEHPIIEETRDMTQNELNDHLNENHISKDVDLFWGGEY